MALTIDIKANDDFAKTAERTAKALDEIAAHEKKVNDLAEKLGTTQQKTSVALARVAKQDAQNDKKTSEAAKKHIEEQKKGTAAWLGTAAAISASAIAAVGLGAELATLAFHADESKRGASALLDAFTQGKGAETMRQLDAQATKLGLSFDETRAKYIEFRQAGSDDRLSKTLINARADMIALGIGAQQADKYIGMVTAQGHDLGAANSVLRQLNSADGLKGVGEGKIAERFAKTSFSAAGNKLENAAQEKLAGLWEKTGNSLGKAANVLSDFLTKLVNSKEAQAALDRMAETLNRISDGFNTDNLTKGLKVIELVAKAVYDVMKAVYDFDSLEAKAVYASLNGIGAVIAPLFSLYQSHAADQAAARNAEYLIERQRAVDAGQNISEGIADGIQSKTSTATDAAVDMAKKTSAATSGPEGIDAHSPSRVFFKHGENVVKGFVLGQQAALPTAMPIQKAATQATSSGGSGGGVVVNLTVNGHGNAQEIGRTVRQELQLLLQAGQLSRGFSAG